MVDNYKWYTVVFGSPKWQFFYSYIFLFFSSRVTNDINNYYTKGGENMTYALNHFSSSLFSQLLAIRDRAIATFDRKLVKYDAWFLVLLAVLMTLAFVLVTALAIWCIVYKGKRFIGNWHWGIYGVSVWVECA